MNHSFETHFPFKAILFDWANTLVDLGQEGDMIPFRQLLALLKDHGIFDGKFEPIYQEYRDLFYGMIEVSISTHREASFELALRYLLIKYGINLENKVTMEKLLEVYYRSMYEIRKVYSDVIPTLAKLQAKGVRLGIISNTTNPEFMKDWERRHFGLDAYFEFSIYSSAVPYRKPHPSIFELAIHRLNLKPNKILFVGDNLKADVLGAKKVGMVAVWLNRNSLKSVDDIHPDYEITSLAELVKLAPLAV